MIDAVIVFGVQLLLGAILRHNHTWRVHYTMTRNNTVHHQSISILVLLLTAVFFFVYSWVMVAANGATVGMLIVRVRAVRASDGGPVSAGAACLRALLAAVLGLPALLLLIVSGFWALGNGRRQTWQDMAAGTLVVQRGSSG